MLVKRTPTNYDDLLLNEKLMGRASLIVPLLVLRQFTYLLPKAEIYIGRFLEALVVIVVLLTLGTLISAFNDLYELTGKGKERPVKGYLQVIKIIIYVMGGIVIIGIFTGQQPWALITGIGAVSAVILLIFRDTILSFVASIQINSYDLVRVNDWIEMPKYGADGDVLDISLNVIKVQNFDKTIVVIPTYKLIEESFKNWRGMKQTGGRRIKRAVYIDITSIKFLDDEMLDHFEKFRMLTDYIKRKREELKEYNAGMDIKKAEIINLRRLTNIGTFREYLKIYLRQREDVNENLTFLIRQLDPGPQGLPIEIYVFANTTDWAEYEDVQSNIFDHILAILPEFGLKVFQVPTSNDIQSLKLNAGEN
jgi:miniconductance mechanosensitive channel